MPQSGSSAGRFVEDSKTSSGLVLSAFRISPLETLALYLGGLDDPARKRFHGSWSVRFALKKTRSFDGPVKPFKNLTLYVDRRDI